MKNTLLILLLLVCKLSFGKDNNFNDTLYLDNSSFCHMLGINFSTQDTDTVSVKIYDITGREISTPFSSQVKAPGTVQTSSKTDSLPDGTYFVILSYGTNKKIIKKCVKDCSNSPTLYVSNENFCDSTIVSFTLTKQDTVFLNLYNRFAQIVSTGLNNYIASPGLHSVVFKKNSLPQDVYLLVYNQGKPTANYKRVSIICNTTSISDIPENDVFKIYPNPAESILNIDMDGEKNIIITNTLGQICKQLKTSSTSISITDLAKGIYILSLCDSKQNLLGRKQIIKN